ncbi:MAG: carbonic anhydrase [Fimbriimonadaceae bacterium]|nr:carbonic anhydrase [Fimbriimonadaceae bacterium]
MSIISRTKDLVGGVMGFYANQRKRMLPMMEKLVEDGQRPHALLITCADSRVVPSLIMGSEPGDLFVLRNIGNIVPPSYVRSNDKSVGAAIEYALEVLHVPNIVVLGHSDCGAMKALLTGQDTGLRHVDEWLRFARASRMRHMEDEDFSRDMPDHDRLSQINVLEQLEHLRTYSVVAERIATMSVTMHAWWFQMNESRVYAFDVRKACFVPLEELYPVLDPETQVLVAEIEQNFKAES